jgi:hypothetical protein
MRASLLLMPAVALGCSTVGGPDPSEEGKCSDDVQVEVDGVLVQCGNLDESNVYYVLGDEGPMPFRRMPVVCMGPQTTPDFDLDDVELTNEGYGFPTWTTEIQASCSSACLAAHDADTDLMPICVEDTFFPNFVWGEWQPAEGPNCDSTLSAEDP